MKDKFSDKSSQFTVHHSTFHVPCSKLKAGLLTSCRLPLDFYCLSFLIIQLGEYLQKDPDLLGSAVNYHSRRRLGDTGKQCDPKGPPGDQKTGCPTQFFPTRPNYPYSAETRISGLVMVSPETLKVIDKSARRLKGQDAFSV